MLLVGVGGSGRRSLAVFANKLANLDLWQLRVTRNYAIRDFHEELKQLVVKAGETVPPMAASRKARQCSTICGEALISGIDGVQTSLLITDKELKTDAFSDSLNSLLCSGQIPGLLDSESSGLLLQELQPVAESAGVSPHPDSLQELFLSRVKENLHVILCVSPIGSKIRDYCRYDAVVYRLDIAQAVRPVNPPGRRRLRAVRGGW